MPKAVVCRELGPPGCLRLETFASKPLAPGQVRIAIRAAGINFPDILMVAGEYQLKPELPFTPGMEAAGDVVEVNGADAVAVGDRVIVKLRHGGYCDEVLVTPSQLTPMPSTFDYAEGATFLAAHGTAYHGLVDRGQLQPCEVLLIHGAGGGVGLAAVEIGKLLGATVIAAASSEEKLDVAKARGADHLVLYSREPFRDAVKRITDGRGADVVFDPVGGDAFAQALRSVAWSGRILVIGFASGSVPQIPANHVLVKNVDIMGFQWGSYRTRRPELLTQGFARLVGWYAEGRLQPVVSHRLKLAAVPEAYRLLRERRATGKIVLETRV